MAASLQDITDDEDRIGSDLGSSEDDVIYYVGPDHELPELSHSGEFDVNTTQLSVDNSTVPELWDLNHEQVKQHVLILILLAVLLLLALVGNSVVCLVYRARFRRNTTSMFVVFLAILDLVTCCIGIPTEAAVLILPLMYKSAVACKITCFVETWIVNVTLLSLTGVAVDRYCKLCRPVDCLPLRHARWICLGAVVLAMLLAIPALILFGTHSVHTDFKGVQGHMCGVDDSMVDSHVIIVYVTVVLVTLVCTTLALAVLYSIMIARIYRRKSAARGERVSPARRDFPRKHRFVTEDSTSSCGYEDSRKSQTVSSSSCSSAAGTAAAAASSSTPRVGRTSQGVDPARVPLKAGVKESARIGQGNSTKVDVQSTRMTYIFFIVSVVCVVCLLPFFVLRTLRVTTSVLDEVLSTSAGVVFYELFVRLYFVHIALKPVVYLVGNPSFRRECRLLCFKLWAFCSKTSESDHAGNT